MANADMEPLSPYWLAASISRARPATRDSAVPSAKTSVPRSSDRRLAAEACCGLGDALPVETVDTSRLPIGALYHGRVAVTLDHQARGRASPAGNVRPGRHGVRRCDGDEH